ncbi:MAG: hypothetical protein GYA23_11815 [Methanomicrobiales archaeon]|nr:hypothetical protein [Methanomicrobiales archaeon]
MAETAITDTVVMAFIIFLGMVVMYLIIREIRIMRTSNRKIELELEKDKLALLQKHEAQKGFPFTRLSAEQVAEIKKTEDEIIALETSIYAKEKLLSARLTKIENLVRDKKLDGLLSNARDQEQKVK